MSKMVFELCYCKVHIIWPCLCADSSTLCMFCATVIPKISLKLEHELRSFTGCWCSGPTAGPQACESCQCFVVVVIFITLSFIDLSVPVGPLWSPDFCHVVELKENGFCLSGCWVFSRCYVTHQYQLQSLVSPTENSASTWLESTFCKNQSSIWSHRRHPLETFTPSSWTKWTNLSQSKRHLIISAKLNGDAEANGFISQIQQATWYLSLVQPAGAQQKEEFPKWQLVSGQSSHWAPLASRLSPAALFHSSLTNWSQLIPNVPSSWILKCLSEIKVFHQNLDSKAAAAEDTEHEIQLLWTPRGSNRTTLCLWGLW